jgi:phosphoglycerate-specific signal transduction histidine kinase
MKDKDLSSYTFERKCGLSNGYLKKQDGGKGTLGSDVLEKIHVVYPRLNMLWVLFNEGKMELSEAESELNGQAQPQAQPQAQNEKQSKSSQKQDHPQNESELLKLQNQVIQSLKDQIDIMKAANADKDRIISLQDDKLNSNSGGVK